MGNNAIYVRLRRWVSHNNMFLSALRLYCSVNKIKCNIFFGDKSLPEGFAQMTIGENVYGFDYSDEPMPQIAPEKFTLYFKRSLLKSDVNCYNNVVPIGFQVNYTYKSYNLLFSKGCLRKDSKVELARCIDRFGMLVKNMPHASYSIDKFENTGNSTDHNGRIIYQTRLWDPARNNDPEEQERREKMNNFRIGACRIIKKHYPDSFVGLFPEEYAQKCAPDLLLSVKDTRKVNFLKHLKNSDIAIADDGLKDTLGWKIGEYVLLGKAVISTPINVEVPGFKEEVNYLEVPSKSEPDSIIDLINKLKSNQEYLKMGKRNLEYGKKYIAPYGYFSYIMDKINNK